MLRRKKIIELEFQCAIGPNGSKLVVPNQGSSEPQKLRVFLSLEYTLPQAEKFLEKWVVDT